MKKYVIAAGIVVVAFLLGFGLYSWSSGKLYLRASGAKVWVNDVENTQSALYESRRGSYFLMLDRGKSTVAYFVLPSGEVAIPTEPVPSAVTLSILTPAFFYRGETEIRAAGTDLFAPDATSSISKKEFSFTIHDEMVHVSFE